VDLGGKAVRKTFFDKVGQVLEKGQIKSTRNRRAWMSNLMKAVEEAKGLCKDCSKWKEVISTYLLIFTMESAEDQRRGYNYDIMSGNHLVA
jgi:hypothetical protein